MLMNALPVVQKMGTLHYFPIAGFICREVDEK